MPEYGPLPDSLPDKGFTYLGAQKEIRKMKKALRDQRDKRPRKVSLKYDPVSNLIGYGRYRRKSRRYARRTRRYRGRGGYLSDAYGWWKNRAYPWLQANVPKGTAAAVGRSLGGMYGNPEAGALWGQKFADITGVGAYNEMDHAAGNYIDQGVPQVYNDRGSDGAMVVRHREYICDIVSAGSAFNIAFQANINPGNKIMFPWLSDVALKFCQYKLEGLIFHFVSTSGALSTSQALGEIIMAANYNVTDPAFVNKQQMLNEVMAVSKVPAHDAELGIECDRKQTTINQPYIRGLFVPEGQDPRFYDFASVTVATQGQAAAGVTLGELWVSYQIALYKPSLVQPGVVNAYESVVYDGSYTPGDNINTFSNIDVVSPSEESIFYTPDDETFRADFEGTVVIQAIGTGLSQASPVAFTGETVSSGPTALVAWLVSTAGTVGTGTYYIKALAGQKLPFVITATTCTEVKLFFNAY